MITPIRIGGLTLHLGQLCYARQQGDRLHLFMSCGQLTLEGREAQSIADYLERHSEEISEPGQPGQRRTELLPPPNTKWGRKL